MLYIKKSTDELVDLTEQQVYDLSYDVLEDLEPYVDDSGEAYDVMLDAKISYADPWRIDCYYPKGDTTNDPDGDLHLEYIYKFDYEPLNEANLIKYSKPNVDIYNQLLNEKYREIGGCRVLTEQYVDNEWPTLWPAYNAVAFGYHQYSIYLHMCAAFGKENVNRVWRKRYAGMDDGLNEWRARL